MIKNFIDPKIKELVEAICTEHWMVSKNVDSNIGYLWYMYAAGTKKGHFRPFIFLSELNLLVKTGYITEVEKQNMLGMLLSKDEENAQIMALALLNFRKQRIEEKGTWTLDNEKYTGIDYSTDIINPELFMKTL
jgi:hypothetical protein